MTCPSAIAPLPELSPALRSRLPRLPAAPPADPRWHLDPALGPALRAAEATTRRVAKSFHFASFALPPHKRAAAFAVYAFCRHVDDALDCRPPGAPVDGWQRRLEEELPRLLDGSSPLDFAPAFAAASRVFAIPASLYLDLIEGVCRDELPIRIGTFAELEDYCYFVASVVGLMMTRIFGLERPEALPQAVLMGIAMQLTNIVRDVAEDARAGRFYLPADERAAAGVSEADLLSAHASPALCRLIQAQVERARAYYAAARPGLAALPADGSRRCATIMARVYAGILDVVEERGHDILAGRAFVPTWRKLLLAAPLLLRRG